MVAYSKARFFYRKSLVATRNAPSLPPLRHFRQLAREIKYLADHQMHHLPFPLHTGLHADHACGEDNATVLLIKSIPDDKITDPPIHPRW